MTTFSFVMFVAVVVVPILAVRLQIRDRRYRECIHRVLGSGNWLSTEEVVKALQDELEEISPKGVERVLRTMERETEVRRCWTKSLIENHNSNIWSLA